MKNKIRPIYSELQGYLTQAPPIGEHGNTTTSDDTLWKQFNITIDELNIITGKAFTKFKVIKIERGQNGQYIKVSNYRQKLGGLISHLYGEYFSDEQSPFSGMPSTIINQNQSQNQSQSLSIILELQEKIINEIPKHKEGTKERNFLEKFKPGLSTIKSVTDILSLALKIGADFGLDPATIRRLLGL